MWPEPKREPLFVKDSVRVLTRGEVPECPSAADFDSSNKGYVDHSFYNGNKMPMYRENTYTLNEPKGWQWYVYFHFAVLYCQWRADDNTEFKYKTYVIIAAHNRLNDHRLKGDPLRDDRLDPDVILDTISLSGKTWERYGNHRIIRKVIQASIRHVFSPPNFDEKKQIVYFKHSLENDELDDTDKEKCSKLTYSFDLTQHFHRGAGEPTAGATLTEKCKAIAGLLKKYQYGIPNEFNSWIAYTNMNCAEPEPEVEEVDCKEVRKTITLIPDDGRNK